MKTLLLIDANALIHRAFHALPPLQSPDGKATQALYGVSTILLKILKEEKPAYAAALFDRPEPTFRDKEFKEYKAQREKAPDDLISQIIECRNLFKQFGIEVFEMPGFEADDLIGTLVEKYKKEKELRIEVLTGDLDALQLVEGEKIVIKTLKTGVSNTVVYDEAAVRERFALAPTQLIDYKALVGDSSDNIPGIPGVGPKTATPLLQKYGSVEGIYKKLDKEPKVKEKFAQYEKEVELYKRLVTIDRHAPVKIKNLEALTLQEPRKLKDYFLSLGFESLAKRLNGGESVEKKEKKEVPATLFSTLSLEAKKKTGDVVFLASVEDALQTSVGELTSSKVKCGFNLKELVKELHKNKKEIKGPYFDFGVGFFLLNPEIKNYSPLNVFKKFLRAEWKGSVNDHEIAYAFLKKELENGGLTKVFYSIEMPLIDALVAMEEKGIAIDVPALKKLEKEITSAIEKLTKTIYQLAGGEVNLNSPKQLSDLLFHKLHIDAGVLKRTKTGQISTRFEILDLLRGKHKIIDILLEYREIFKLLSTYVKPILGLVDDKGRLHTHYLQTGAATGRLASEDPNLQNIPANYEWADRLRNTFVSEKGFTLVAFDYSQIELRILASLSEDQKMIEVFKEGKDIHAATASFVFKIPIEKVTGEQRRVAKTLNFGINYGMGSNAFARVSGFSRVEAKKFIDAYFQTFSGIRYYQERLIAEARKTGKVVNSNGRIRLVPAISYGKTREGAEAERIVINMPPQSIEADIMKLAMIQVFEEVKDKEAVRMLLTIHDELLLEVRNDMISKIIPKLQQIMEKVYTLKVPLTVNVKTGKNLSSMHHG